MLMSASWQVLKKDKELLVFPLISSICGLVLLAVFFVPVYQSGFFTSPDERTASNPPTIFYLVFFAFYFCSYFIVVFFNSAVIACAVMRMEGGDPTVSDGFRAAFSRLGTIAAWAFVSASVGLILKAIEDRSKLVGRIVAWLLGVAWTVASFLVIPILVVEGKGPIDALRESTAMLRKTWGQQLVGKLGFGAIFLIVRIPAIVLIVLGFMSVHSGGLTILSVLCFAAGVLWIFATSVYQSALSSTFQAAVYMYARDGQAPDGFDAQLITDVMTRR